MKSSKYLIVDPSGFMAKYIRRELCEAGVRDDDVHVGIDLEEREPYDTVFVYLDGNVVMARNMFDTFVHNGLIPANMVLLSSTAVYGRDRGEDYDEDTPQTPTSLDEMRASDVERVVSDRAIECGICLTVLRMPPIVGTGMTGILRKLVNGIYRGSLTHIEGNEARVSVVHAVDVARAARLTARKGGVYNVTDGVSPTVHDLMEALAFRLDDKRIFTVSPKRARRIAWLGRIIPQAFNPRMLEWMTTTLTFSSERIAQTVDFKPHSVVEYLRTHDYDDNSL